MTNINPPATAGPFGSALDKLADTVRHVVDLVAGPDRIRAKAQAQAAAEVTLAEGRAQAQDIEARAIDRIRKREVRRQQNIEAITVEAVKALPAPDRVSPEPVHEDWTTRFFEECKDISDKEMQSLWARILVREVASPRSISPRTLTVVRDMTKTDAELFTSVCTFVWQLGSSDWIAVVESGEAARKVNPRLSFSELTHLETIGLIKFNSLSGYGLLEQSELGAAYYGKRFVMRSAQSRSLNVGVVMLTGAGHDLVAVCGSRGNDRVMAATVDQWRREGWTVEEDRAASASSEPE
jgi:hypothetical protein